MPYSPGPSSAHFVVRTAQDTGSAKRLGSLSLHWEDLVLFTGMDEPASRR